MIHLSPKEKEDFKKEIDESILANDGRVDQILKEAELQNKKKGAQDALDKQAEDAKKEIDALDTLSQQEKDALKKEIDDAVLKGKQAIQDAGTPDEAEIATNQSNDEVNAIKDKAILQNQKNKANADVETAFAKAKDRIEKSDLSAKEKALAIQALEAIRDQGLKAIDESMSADDISKHRKTTLKAFEDYHYEVLPTTGLKTYALWFLIMMALGLFLVKPRKTVS